MYVSLFERHQRRVRMLRLVLFASLGLLVTVLLDQAAHEFVTVRDPWGQNVREWARAEDARNRSMNGPQDVRLADRLVRTHVETYDWYKVLRSVGNIIPWMVVSGCVLGAGWHERRNVPRPAFGVVQRTYVDLPSRALLITLAPALAGLGADILKPIFQRHRPDETAAYVFNWFGGAAVEPHAFGLPSSHAAVAFGAATIIAKLYPGTVWVIYPLAIGCGLSRMLVGAHFLSDVYVGALLGYAVAAGLYRAFSRPLPVTSSALHP